MKNSLTAAILITAIAPTCGLSTVRGCYGMISSGETKNAMVRKIHYKKLNPDCLSANPEVAKALEPILGYESANRVTNSMAEHVETYKKEMREAKNDEDREDAANHLASWLSIALKNEMHKQASGSEKAEWWWVAMTMFALGEASSAGATGVVFGPKFRECMDAITCVCARCSPI